MPSSRSPKIIIGGTIAIDHVKTPHAEASDLLGGSAAYAAFAASFHATPVALVGIVGQNFPAAHLAMLKNRGISLDGVEHSPEESFTWSGEYHDNMNERTTHRVGLNVLENWQVKVPAAISSAPIVVLANMSPDNQLQMLEQCLSKSDPGSRFVIADTMDLWIEIAADALQNVLPKLDLFVLNDSEARSLAGSSSLVEAGRKLLEFGPRFVVIKLGEFGAMLFSKDIPEFRCVAYPIARVQDPTGAGDSFLGAIAGYLAAQEDSSHQYSAETLRKAVIHGTIMASFTCENFSTRRLEQIQMADVDARLNEFRDLTCW